MPTFCVFATPPAMLNISILSLAEIKVLSLSPPVPSTLTFASFATNALEDVFDLSQSKAPSKPKVSDLPPASAMDILRWSISEVTLKLLVSTSAPESISAEELLS